MPYIFQSLSSPSSQAFSTGGIADVMPSMRIPLPKKKLKSSSKKLDDLNNYNFALPISQIPFEVLCHIFSFYANDPYPPSIGPLSYYSGRNPMILGQVCTRWRNVALNLPSLWTTIYVTQPTKVHVHLVNLWLERAADQPLDVTLKQPGHVPSAWAILRSLVSRCQFWKKIFIVVPVDVLPHFAGLLQAPLRCDLLESVQFSHQTSESKELLKYERNNPEWKTPYLRDIWSFFHSSASLEEVNWTGTLEACSYESAPFDQMTSVQLFGCGTPLDAEAVIGFLRLFPNLRSFGTGVSPDASQIFMKPSIPSSPVPLHRLESLNLNSETPIDLIFSHISCPSLRHLNMMSTGCTEPLFGDSPPFQCFLQRSNCSPEKLQYYDRSSLEQFLEDCLKSHSLQSLIEFDYSGKVSDSTISLLSQRSGTGLHVYLPFLEGLHFSKCETTDGMIANLISSRILTLKDFSFYSDKRRGPIDEQILSMYNL
ncbi:hypothetical protein NLJ89_g3793 [Agrocybe chaxingu]|uniref:F-box domain-containing protein n=1 Tax=Agrocybe chaxingu TaxID=84603 RepID=A0A9W8K450_9AGAR|nr:hypothetical protein NLJ89_g3793 [Agrocybe chaxingu]